jgi:hydroxymethylpyrimidine pyrophosphatase-like HAD family hydrolase
MYQNPNNQLTVAFDIDGTLIYDERFGSQADTPRYDVIGLYHTFQGLDFKLYIWSGGGVDYARHWAQKLGLVLANIVVKGSFIPDIAIDDEEVNLGKVNIKV